MIKTVRILQNCIFQMYLISADDEDSGPFLSHGRQDVYVLYEDVLVLPLRRARLTEITPQIFKTYVQVFEEVQHAHPDHDHQKAPDGAHHIHSRHGSPLFKQNHRGAQDHGGEEDVVDGVHQERIEGV